MDPLLPLAAAVALGGADISTQVVLSIPGDFERNVVRYECESIEPFAVDYINAAPNFLAIVPINGEKTVFVNVLSASGAKYVAGQYEWWTKGSEASFSDLQSPDAQPVTCLEHVETP